MLERATVQTFSPKQYVLFYQHILLAALLTALVCALSHIERIPLSAQALGLSLRIPRERKNFVLPYVALMAPAGLSISLFPGYFKYKGVPIHQLVLPLPVELLSLRAADSPSEHLLAILPYAISVLVLSPIVEEIYFTRIVFPALRNRLGLVAGACLTASIFALFHPSANVLSDGTWVPFSVIAGAQLTSVHSTRARARSTLLSPRTHCATLPSFFSESVHCISRRAVGAVGSYGAWFKLGCRAQSRPCAREPLKWRCDRPERHRAPNSCCIAAMRWSRSAAPCPIPWLR